MSVYLLDSCALRQGFALTVIEAADAEAAGRLSWGHEDPFDRGRDW